MSPWEAGGVLFGVVGVWLTTRESVWCWPTMLASAAAYIVVFFQTKLYAAMGLQVGYVLLFLYGWYEWLHGGPGHGALAVSRTPRRWRAPLLALGTAGAAVLGFTLGRHTDESLPYWDSATTSFSVVAQWMQTRKWLENWLLWIAVDLAYVGMFVYKRVLPTAGLYAIFLILAVMGFVEWRKSMAARGRPAPR